MSRFMPGKAPPPLLTDCRDKALVSTTSYLLAYLAYLLAWVALEITELFLSIPGLIIFSGEMRWMLRPRLICISLAPYTLVAKPKTLSFFMF